MKTLMISLSFSSILLASCSYSMSLMGLESDSTETSSNGASSMTPEELDVQSHKILAANCSTCHGTNSGSADVYGLNDTQHLVDSGLVTPGNPTQSPLFEEIDNNSMPPDGPLSNSDKEVIRTWIAGMNASTAAPAPTPAPAPPAPAPAPSPAPPAGPEATFSYIEKNILATSCVSCHSAKNARAGIALDTYNAVLKTVNKNNPSKSLLYRETQSGSMPPRPRKVLNSEQLHLILSWIEQGAKNN